MYQLIKPLIPVTSKIFEAGGLNTITLKETETEAIKQKKMIVDTKSEEAEFLAKCQKLGFSFN